MKERLRSYMDQQIQTDPSFFYNLSKFQNEADMRVSAMRRIGVGEENLSSSRHRVQRGSSAPSAVPSRRCVAVVAASRAEPRLCDPRRARGHEPRDGR
jgi:hypothetical protein